MVFTDFLSASWQVDELSSLPVNHAMTWMTVSWFVENHPLSFTFNKWHIGLNLIYLVQWFCIYLYQLWNSTMKLFDCRISSRTDYIPHCHTDSADHVAIMRKLVGVRPKLQTWMTNQKNILPAWYRSVASTANLEQWNWSVEDICIVHWQNI